MSSQNVYFYQGSAPSSPDGPGISEQDYASGNYVPGCFGNCMSGTSTSIAGLQGQLQNGATLYGLLSWAVSQGPSFGPNGVGPAQSDWIGGEGNGWCGRGGAGPPSGNGWGCMAHDYGYYGLGANWWPNNYDPRYAKGKQLQQVNQTLCNSVSGAGGIEITLFFTVGPWGCR